MVYAWEFNHPEDAIPVLERWPERAQSALVAFMDALVFDPHGYARAPAEPAGRAVRWLAFDEGRGLVTVLMDDWNRLVLIVDADHEDAAPAG